MIVESDKVGAYTMQFQAVDPSIGKYTICCFFLNKVTDNLSASFSWTLLNGLFQLLLSMF